MTQASGAGRTGLDRLIELTAGGNAADAFVAVALAGTLFFSTSVNAARGRVALALLVTMAPFAVLAPLIGPMLDKFQQGRRYLLIGTLIARGLLCWGMAGAVQHNDTLTLLPAAFGVLVLQKAYGVTRSAVTPRLLPPQITLVSANARSALAALIASTVGAAVAAGVDVAAGGGASGAAWVLRVGTILYFLTIPLGLRLPDRVDRPHEADGAPEQPASQRAGPEQAASQQTAPQRTVPQQTVPPSGSQQTVPQQAASRARGTTGLGPAGPGRAAAGSGRRPGAQGAGTTAQSPRRARFMGLLRVGPIVGEAMRGNAALRAFSGFMVFFLAFLLRIVHFPGVNDKLALGAMIGAAAAGGFIGTAVGAGIRARAPHLILFVMLMVSTIVTAACAALFGLAAALIVALVAAFGQVLGKLALDSIVQREIPEEIRSSTLAASETIHQLAWVAGGLAGLAMSFTSSGVAGLSVAAAGLAATTVLLLASRRHRSLAAHQAGAPQAAR
ncbi:MAG TPA: MFS transporter [Streptosporangiaceae bacterium]|jgi:MFS family permease|nr:MFS transporter [Streptosporangiaceae bacterium]